MDKETYTNYFLPLLIKLSCVQVNYKMNKLDDEKDKKFAKIVCVMTIIIKYYIKNPELNFYSILSEEITGESYAPQDNNLFELLLLMAQINVKYTTNKMSTLTEYENTFLKIIKNVSLLINNYVNDDNILFDDVNIEPLNKSITIENKKIQNYCNIIYKYEEFDANILSQEYCNQLELFYENANNNLQNIIANKNYTIEII
jgi:hypothetical protein